MTTAEWTADAINILLIMLIVCVSWAGIIAVKGFIEERMLRKRSIRFALVFGFLFMVYLVVHVLADLNLLADWDALSGLREILPSGWAQIFLVLSLVGVTGFYALMAFRQAREMREQRRPIVVQQAIYEKDIWEGSTSNYFSHFEVYNKGNGPAIEVEISLVDSDKRTSIDSHRKSFLGAGEPPIEFRPSNIVNLEESITYYFVCEYQSILSSSPQKMWYQTWLPFKPSKSSKEGKIYVVAGELEFKEATEKERIDAFSSRSKPK